MRVLPAGDTAVVVEFGDRIDRALSHAVVQLARYLRASPPAGVVEVVPTFRSLLVHYNPLVTSGSEIAAAIRGTDAAADRNETRGRRWTLPICYAPQFALDLTEVAERTGLTAGEVIARHAATEFHVYMIGFSPGHPYMGDLPGELAQPRRADPRLRVPAGSVAIASTLSVMYPADSPSGWHVIGATPVRLFDASWQRPSLLAPGDVVRFERIGVPEFEALQSAVARDDYQPVSAEVAS